jgi:hypothetical protein
MAVLLLAHQPLPGTQKMKNGPPGRHGKGAAADGRFGGKAWRPVAWHGRSATRLAEYTLSGRTAEKGGCENEAHPSGKESR